MPGFAAMIFKRVQFRGFATLGLSLTLTSGQAFPQQAAPVSPTIQIPEVGRSTLRTFSLRMNQPNAADEAKKSDGPVATSTPELGLAECVAIALEKQPRLKAVKSSQRATDLGLQSLNNIGPLGAFLSPDLPIRKQQAERGVNASAAYVQKLHNEIVHDTTRLYYTAVYARQQAEFAEDIVARVELLVKIANQLFNAGMPNMSRDKINVMEIGLLKVKEKLATAKLGEQQAYSSLREIMAVQNENFPFKVKDKALPVMTQKVPLTKEMVVEMALCRRPEMALATAGVDAFRLEVYAQSMIKMNRSVPTLASGSDIHSAIIPPGSRDPNQEYRPEPVLPEMPPQVVGSRKDRVSRVMEYSQRADAAYESIRNLVVLEAEVAFWRFELARTRVELGKTKAEKGRELMDFIQDLVDNPKAPKEPLLQGFAVSAEAQSEYLEAVFQYLLHLAALERITAGGIRPAFPGR